MIIGLIGLIDSGKGTVGDMLIDNGFVHESFANSLKDATASIFGWDRAMLEGDTNLSRVQREVIDPWWEEKLGIPNFTPRLALQLLGTDVFRNNFHNDIWILSLEKALKDITGNVVVTDARFPNEVTMIRRAGGKVIRVKRGPDPEWFELAAHNVDAMPHAHPEIHASEYMWANITPDYLINNEGTIKDLHSIVNDLLEDLRDAIQ
jgi:hypothetical protein